MKNSLTEESLRDLSGKLQQANNKFAEIYPGESGQRQPVHMFMPVLFKSDSAGRLDALARRSFLLAPMYLI